MRRLDGLGPAVCLEAALLDRHAGRREVWELLLTVRIRVVGAESAVQAEKVGAWRDAPKPAHLVGADALGELASVPNPRLRRLANEQTDVSTVEPEIAE